MNSDIKSMGTPKAEVEAPIRTTICDNCAKKDVCKYSEIVYDLTLKGDGLAKSTNTHFLFFNIDCLRFLKSENYFDRER